MPYLLLRPLLLSTVFSCNGCNAGIAEAMLAQSDAQWTAPLSRPAASPWAKVRLGPAIGGFDRPVAIERANDGSGRLFVVEQTGLIKVVAAGGKVRPEPFYDATRLIKTSHSEQGLLGLAFHPKFKDNGRLFIGYTDSERDDAYAELVAPDKQTVDRASLRVLFAIDDPFGNHNGGHVAFGPDGLLYIGTGDGGGAGDPQRNGQKDETLLAKMLRLDVDKLPPKGTPVAPERWAKGLRNPWRYSFDAQTGDLWIADVGQNRHEWVHLVPRAEQKPGLNFGWNVVEGTFCYGAPSCSAATKGFRVPVFEYHHDDKGGCSITGGVVYRGKAVPALVGTYVVGDYCSGRIWGVRKTASGHEHAVLIDASGALISSFGEDEQGEVWVADHKGEIRPLVGG